LGGEPTSPPNAPHGNLILLPLLLFPFLFRYRYLPIGNFAQSCDDLAIFTFNQGQGSFEKHFGSFGRRMHQSKTILGMIQTILDSDSRHNASF